MGITKQYLRWTPAEKFGVIGSPCQAIQLIHQWPGMAMTDRICATAACEDIVFWDLKTCQLIERFDMNDDANSDASTKNSMISCMAFNDKSMIICSGHHDGCIRLFDCQESRKLKVVFSGHRGCVSCIAFDQPGLRIATGGKDTEIVIWDAVNQSGLFRLKGHKGPVNKVEFMRQHPWILISASNDTFIKLWDLETQHCFRTIVGHRTEVWSFVLLRDDTEIISGGSDSELKLRSNEEITVKMKKRIRKEKKRCLEENEDLNDQEVEKIEAVMISDEIERLDTVKTVGKIRSIDIRFIRSVNDEQEYRLAFLLCNNQIEFQQITIKSMKNLSKQLSIINTMGHRNDIRAISISSDSLSILTASSDSVKLWNKSSCR
ncbi:hypothetical protein BLA29_005248, partial [Euroglyphus maynei]